jgi:16S rRNA (cytosine967-C5)-methyltransferase
MVAVALTSYFWQKRERLMADAREVALNVLLRVEYDGAYSNLVLDKALRSSRLDGRDSALAAALVYGVLECRITLDYILSGYVKQPLKKLDPPVLCILRMGIYQLVYLQKIPASAAVNESVILSKKIHKERAAGFINGVLRAFVRAGCKYQLPDPDKDLVRHWSIRYSCPERIISLWRASYGDASTLELLRSLAGRPPLTVRVNSLRIATDALSERLRREGVQARPIEGMNDTLTLDHTGSVSRLKSYRDGLFHVQDLSSQLCCKAVAPRPGDRVIDVCSAPGGKAFTLAQMMGNTGEVLAFDLYEQKVRTINEGAKRLGITNLHAAVRDASQPAESLEPADRVLCDVPCSGLGVLRRKPEIRYGKLDGLDSLPDLQYLILCESAKLVKNGGLLVYSTCTLNPSENNLIADRFVKEHPEYLPEPLSFPGFTRNSWELEHQMTFMPNLHGSDGFFLSRFRRVR